MVFTILINKFLLSYTKVYREGNIWIFLKFSKNRDLFVFPDFPRLKPSVVSSLK